MQPGSPYKDMESYELKPEEAVREAGMNKCLSIAYTYTEPTIFFEYAFDTARIAKEKDISNIFVSNGFMTKQAVDLISPYLDACNIDLKFFKDETYQKLCQGRLEPVLENIRYIYSLGIWLEVTTLLIPGLNDSEHELRKMASFLADISKDIPWHITRFHPDFKYTESEPTSLESLKKAKNLAGDCGLRYVYIGNTAEPANTYCHECGRALIKRDFPYGASMDMKETRCKGCGASVAGRFR
jgi:pyruvate formate lyase activating enzyme